MKKKWASGILAVAMLLSLATGCGGKNGSGADSENSITVLVESGSPAETLAKNTAADFEAETGCHVIVDAYSGMYDKLSTEIKANASAHDVACMDFVWLPLRGRLSR